jgi:hypothetical protein
MDFFSLHWIGGVIIGILLMVGAALLLREQVKNLLGLAEPPVKKKEVKEMISDLLLKKAAAATEDAGGRIAWDDRKKVIKEASEAALTAYKAVLAEYIVCEPGRREDDDEI